MFRAILAVVIAATLTGCPGAVSPPESPPAPEPAASVRDDAAACEAAKDVVRTCYDNSSPQTSCYEVYAVALRASYYLDLPPSQQAVFTELCTRSCDMRKNGVAWSSINGSLCT